MELDGIPKEICSLSKLKVLSIKNLNASLMNCFGVCKYAFRLSYGYLIWNFLSAIFGKVGGVGH